MFQTTQIMSNFVQVQFACVDLSPILASGEVCNKISAQAVTRLLYYRCTAKSSGLKIEPFVLECLPSSMMTMICSTVDDNMIFKTSPLDRAIETGPDNISSTCSLLTCMIDTTRGHHDMCFYNPLHLILVLSKIDGIKRDAI
jgi:hypothetical protein